MGKVHSFFFLLYTTYLSLTRSLTISYNAGRGLFFTSPPVFLSQFYIKCTFLNLHL